MIMTIDEARKAMGKAAAKYTDAQIDEMINTMSFLADMAIDTWLAKTPEERKKFTEQYKKPMDTNEKAKK